MSLPNLGYLSTWYQSIATNKDRIDKLELELQDLKDRMQKLSTDSQANFHELKDMFSKSLEKGESSTTKEKVSTHMSGEKSSGHSSGSKGSNGFAKLDFPRYLGDDPTV
jgi:predicted  nucleic acid-binding Zn-ribbon protein